jgi:hypothetical protein
MRKNISTIVIAVILAAAAGWWLYSYFQPGEYDAFAKCLNEKGAVFYGAFWCPHCQNQKTMFGKSAKYLNYVECSTPDGRSQLPVCQEAGIDGYPTWKFADGSRLTGEIPLGALAEKTGCKL